MSLQTQLGMTFGIKNSAVKQLQFIIVYLILANLIVRMFAIPVPVSPYFHQNGSSSELRVASIVCQSKEGVQSF